MRHYAANRREANQAALNNPLAAATIAFAKKLTEPWKGTATDLLAGETRHGRYADRSIVAAGDNVCPGGSVACASISARAVFWFHSNVALLPWQPSILRLPLDCPLGPGRHHPDIFSQRVCARTFPATGPNRAAAILSTGSSQKGSFSCPTKINIASP